MLLITSSDRCYVSDLLEKLKYKKEDAPNGSEVYKASYNDHEFILLVTGYGKVNIGSSLRYACEKYNVGAVISTGTCGSISDTNDIFSAIIPNSSLEFDVDFMPNGYMAGQIPKVNKAVYNTNDDLTDCLVSSCNKLGINYSNNVIASSDMFVSNYNLANSIRKEYNAGAVDTETGSIGQFCYINNISYAGLKIVSNFANNNGIKQYNLYDKQSSKISNKIIYEFLKEFYDE